jgi:hypothetical protein
MNGNVVIFEVDALVYDVLSGEEEHVIGGETVGTTGCINRVSHKLKSL